MKTLVPTSPFGPFQPQAILNPQSTRPRKMLLGIFLLVIVATAFSIWPVSMTYAPLLAPVAMIVGLLWIVHTSEKKNFA